MNAINGFASSSDSNFPTPQFRTSQEVPASRGEARRCRQRFTEMKSARREREVEWRRWLRIVRGDHWGIGVNPLLSGPGWRARPVINMTVALKRQKAAILLESRPRTQIAPRSPHQDGIAAEANAVMQHLQE